MYIIYIMYILYILARVLASTLLVAMHSIHNILLARVYYYA